jgi:hypothetical protein
VLSCLVVWCAEVSEMCAMSWPRVCCICVCFFVRGHPLHLDFVSLPA